MSRNEVREIALDTVCLNHLLRTPAHRSGAGTGGTAIDKPISTKRLRLLLDESRGLLSEWERTCGVEAVQAALAQWEPYGGVRLVGELPPIPRRCRDKLRRLGFDDTIDKIVLRLGAKSNSSTVVSDDSDFWDPDPKKRGDSHGAVAALIRTSMGVTVMLLGQFTSTL